MKRHKFNTQQALRLPLSGTSLAFVTAFIAALIAGCASSPMPTGPAPAPAPAPQVTAPPYSLPPIASTSPTKPPAAVPVPVSNATTPRDYRRDAAGHLYARNADRIFKGKLPPLLYAVGVCQVDVDARGSVVRVSWMRAPSHAPEVVAEIERTIRLAAPFPAPARMGRVTYTDTWLWDASGRFQLDTLTEGQL